MLQSNLVHGLLFSMVLGAIVVWLFWLAVGWWSDLPLKKDLERSTGNLLTGSVERGFFTLVVAYKVGDPVAAMMAWIAIKLAANWGHYSQAKDPKIRKHAFRAILTGMVSMLLALIGGRIASGERILW
jgi:hypothetical protein